eukprot:scaffold277663_cov17-Prasinocladus_malaysianus.AAC.1
MAQRRAFVRLPVCFGQGWTLRALSQDQDIQGANFSEDDDDNDKCVTQDEDEDEDVLRHLLCYDHTCHAIIIKHRLWRLTTDKLKLAGLLWRELHFSRARPAASPTG